MYETQKAIIEDELGTASAELNMPTPPWSIVPGRTSIYDHDTKAIGFSETALQLYDESKLRKLVRHEARHAWQDYTGTLQWSRKLRELEAERYALSHYHNETYPSPVLNRPAPFRDAVVVATYEPRYFSRVVGGLARDTFPFDSQCNCCCR